MNSFQIMAHSFNMLLPECKEVCYHGVIPLILSGFSQAIYGGCFYAILPDLIEARMTGTAFGIFSVVINLGWAVLPTIGDAIHDSTLNYKGGFFWVILHL